MYIDKVLITLVLVSLTEYVFRNSNEERAITIKIGVSGEGVMFSILTASGTENPGAESSMVDETGLKLSRGIVEAHGGRLKVRSVSGKISEVSFTVPVVGVG